MKNSTKIVGFILLFIVIFKIDVFAQSIQIIYCDTLNTKTVYEEIKSYAQIKNNSFSTILVGVKIIKLDTSLNHTFNYCWNNYCKGLYPVIEINTKYDTLNAGESTALLDFDISVTPGDTNALGPDLFKIIFYNKNNANDTAVCYMKFVVTGTGVEEIISDNPYFSTAYPNPATNSITISYQLPQNIISANLNIFDENGNFINNYVLNIQSNSINFPVNTLTSGNYYYSIISNNKLIFKNKFVVVK
jgi:hypothetical protein